MKKLEILIPMVGFGRAGGMRVLSQLANNWIELGHSVNMVSYYESENVYYPTDAQIVWINLKGEEVPKNSVQYSIKNLGLKRMYAIYNFLKGRSSKYDVILASHNQTVWPIAMGSKSQNYYYIQAYEPSFYDHDKNIKSFIKKFGAWLTYFLPLTRVVNSHLYFNYKNIKSKDVIYPGLDLKVFKPREETSKFDKDSFVVGCIGRKEEWKGSQDVADAVKILHDNGYNIKLKVAFNPVNHDKYELIKPDGDNKLAEFYKSLDVLVAPGHIQLGAVHYPVIEAMACKIPVITTGYYPANEENAFIVPVKSPDIIADTIVQIIENQELAIKKSEIAFHEIHQFDWRAVSRKFIEIFYSKITE